MAKTGINMRIFFLAACLSIGAISFPLSLEAQNPGHTTTHPYEDGPYILFENGQAIARWVTENGLEEDTLRDGRPAKIFSGAFDAFDPAYLDLEDTFQPAPTANFKKVSRVAAVSDIHGQYGLSTGGLFGTGLGASREKWGGLPEAHTDFIFAVIGEELGLVGTVSVLAMFAIIAIVAIREARNTDDLFVKLATGGILAWIVGQALVNIGAVLGLLPITGLPLPMVSYGGSSLLMCLCAIGVLLAFARAEPTAATALRSRRGDSRTRLLRRRGHH